MKWPLLLSVVGLLAACQGQDGTGTTVGAANEEVALTTLSPGASAPLTRPDPAGNEFTNSAYHLSQGKKWFSAFNCNGCHGNGGGGSGPPLMDSRWIYGGTIENIVQSIREGRPNGMPSWRGRISDDQIWELAAYVLSMSGNVPSDVAPGRSDDMKAKPPENTMSPTPPVNGGTVPKSAEAPQ